MKAIFRALLCLMLSLVCCQPLRAASSDDGVLRILAIGNSFSDDAMEYHPALLENLQVDDVHLARLYVGGCSLQQHAQFYRNNESPYTYTTSQAGENRWVEQKEKMSLKAALAQGEWDIITLQQQSGHSGIFSSFEPHLDFLIKIIKQAQPNARIAWHMTWSYSTNSSHNDFPRYERDSHKMLEAIYDATKASAEAHPEIDIIIPCGTTIQSLRKSVINNPPLDLTRDGFHMGYGAGRYALACTWYEQLIEPYTNRSMVGNTLRINKGNINVTPIIAAYCQKAAKMAVRRQFISREIKHVGRALRKAQRGKNQIIVK